MRRLTTSFRLIALVALVILIVAPVGHAAETFDLQGRTLRFLTWDKWLGNEVGEFEEGADLAHKQWVEKTFNCKIELVDVWGTYVFDLPAQILAGDIPVNIIPLPNVWLEAHWANEGLLWPLNEILDVGFESKYPPEYNHREFGTYSGGKIYGICPPPSTGQGGTLPMDCQVVLWNKSLFERENLPSLYDLYAEGDWTWDTLMDLAIKATRDTDGDGEIDQWGFSSRMGPIGGYLWWLDVLGWMLTNGEPGVAMEGEDGRPAFALDRPGAIEAIEWWSEIYRLGVYAPEQFHFADLFSAGKVAMRIMPISLLSAVGVTAHEYLEMNDDYGIVPYPKGPNASAHVSPITEPYTMGIPITEPDPRAVIEVYNALYKVTTDYKDMDQWRQDQYDQFAMYIRDDESYEMAEWAGLHAKQVRLWRVFEEQLAVLNDAVMGTKSPAAAVAEIKPAVQAILDEMSL